jgi:hypothetical protein
MGGEVIAVRQLPVDGMRGAEGVEFGRVAANALESSEIVDLLLDTRLSRVQIGGVEGRSSAVVLRDYAGNEYQPTSRNSERIQFEGIPEGPIYVGPPPWAEQLYGRRMYELGNSVVQVSAGVDTFLEWDERWSLAEQRSGTIEYRAPGRLEILLVPVYGTSKVPLPLRLTLPSVPIGADGRYEIPAGEPMPEALLVCWVTQDGGEAPGRSSPLTVHDAIVPGEDLTLELGELELIWDAGEWENAVIVTWPLPEHPFQHPDGAKLVRLGNVEGSALWARPPSVILKGLPAGRRDLRFMIPSIGWDQEIEVIAGERRTIVLKGREQTDK